MNGRLAVDKDRIEDCGADRPNHCYALIQKRDIIKT